MFFISDTSSSSSDETNKNELKMQRKVIRQKSDIFNLTDHKFESYFRLNKTAFKYVLGKIRPKMKVGIRSTSVSNTIKLAATLGFLAQGSYQLNVGNNFNLGLSQPTVCSILSETLTVLEDIVCPLWIKFNMTNDEKVIIKREFLEKTGFPGVIGCVAGTHIKILAPKKQDQPLYCNRKGFFSLNAMVICDHKMRIRYLDARHAGSASDSLIWNVSDARSMLRDRCEAGERNCWLLGDAGYPLEPYLMAPYRSAAEGSLEAVFNKKHAKARNIVGQTIGVLKNRFRCLLGNRPLHYKPAKATKIANVCAALHNICIEFGSDIAMEEISDGEHVQINFDSNEDAENTQNTEALQIREQIKCNFVE
ncbi:putative nuclease HARBI1 isoform X1 [Rhagoletis pomonella]|uniref:putative nuclease HARBI1 isoform X1 n=2 Tax=Rhagoletis pomonella TaxID=28610 RepID=UPI001787394A|nr:putative nuclease HARBI1 isoform X1 [Rhagoletis pomonella]